MGSHRSTERESVKTVWEHLAEAERCLDRYSCQCGSGGGMACDEDCPGSADDTYARRAITEVVEAIRVLARKSGCLQ